MFRSPSMIIWRPSGSYLAIRIPATKFSTTVLNRRSRSAATVCLQYFAVSNIYRFGHLKRKNSNCLSSKDLPFLHKYCQYNLKKNSCLFSVLSTPSTSYRVGAPFPTASCPLLQKRLRLTSIRTFWACNSRPLPRTPGQQIRRKGYWSWRSTTSIRSSSWKRLHSESLGWRTTPLRDRQPRYCRLSKSIQD